MSGDSERALAGTRYELQHAIATLPAPELGPKLEELWERADGLEVPEAAELMWLAECVNALATLSENGEEYELATLQSALNEFCEKEHLRRTG